MGELLQASNGIEKESKAYKRFYMFYSMNHILALLLI